MERRAHPARLEVAGVTASYDRVPVLRAVTFGVGPGELLGVVGPNGAGKSTLLKVAVGLMVADAGRVTVDGGPIAEVLRYVAYLPQRALVDWDYPAVVRDVVAMGRAPHLGRLRRPGRADRALVQAAIDRLGLTDLADRPIGELSGGQRQRAFLARALAQEARIMLFDEPFAGIDAVTERMLWDELSDLRDAGATIVVVNHDLRGVMDRCDRLLLLAGRVVALGRPAEAGSPDNLLEAYGGVAATGRTGDGGPG
jgi:ABC-type Mn2+/Zn2+ transport system ATPase subunit